MVEPILINGRFLTRPLSGVQRYAHEIVRALGRLPDQALVFAPLGGGRFVSTTPLPAGRWRLRLDVRADGHVWRHEGDVL